MGRLKAESVLALTETVCIETGGWCAGVVCM